MRPQLYRTTAILALTVLAACATPVSPATTMTTALGPVLADQKGMTLYASDRDGPGKSNCTGQCATNWPPFLAPAGATASGDWSVVKRDDGTTQWAYKGRPLYDWSKDQKPGDTTGNGLLNGAWHAAQP